MTGYGFGSDRRQHLLLPLPFAAERLTLRSNLLVKLLWSEKTESYGSFFETMMEERVEGISIRCDDHSRGLTHVVPSL